MNYKLFRRNFVGLFIVFIPVFTLVLYMNHERSYSVYAGVICSLVASMVISVCIMIFDPYVIVDIVEKEKIDKLKKRNQLINKLKNNEYFIDKSDLLFGDVEYQLTEKGLSIRGSKYRINKLIQGI